MSGSGLLYLSDNPVKFPPVTRTTPVFYDETNQEIFAMSGDLVTIYNAVSHVTSLLTTSRNPSNPKVVSRLKRLK